MRIGYLTYGLDRSPTGIGRYALELLRELASRPGEHEIVVLATEPEDTHQLRDLCEYHHLPGVRLLPSLLTLGDAMIAAASRRLQLDLVHDPNGIAPFLGPRGTTRRTVTIHDTFAYVYPETHNRLDNWRYRHHLPIAAKRADAIITVSECSRRDIVRFLGIQPERVHVTIEGVRSGFRPLEDDATRRAVLERYGIRQPYILYVGGLNARKNIGRLLEAFARVQPSHPDLALVIAGERQWQTGEIDHVYRRLDLARLVHFTGYVDDADLPALYSGATGFIFPSLYEGFGLPPLEAMACGTPVITSNVSSLPEVVGDAALMVDPFDVSAIAGAISRLIADPTLCDCLRERGLRRAARFTWDQAAHETLAAFQETASQPIESPGRARRLPSSVHGEGQD